MKEVVRLLMLSAIALLVVAAGAEVAVEKVDYHGWRNTYKMSNGMLELYLVTDVGPRVIDLRPAGGENIFFVFEEQLGKSGEPTLQLRGGWRLWIAPERFETTWLPDNEPCEVHRTSENSILVVSPPQKPAGIQKIVSLTIYPDQPRVRVVQKVRNISQRPLTYAIWSLSMMRPGGKAIAPLDQLDPSELAAIRAVNLWSYAEMTDPRYYWGEKLVIVDQSKVPPPPEGQKGRRDDESKIGIFTRQGWVAYFLDGNLYIKRFPYLPGATYPDNNSTVEIYSCHRFIECENLGPLSTFGPGEEIELTEDWYLFTGVRLGDTEEEIYRAIQGYLALTKPIGG